MTDPILELSHDHGDINRRLLALGVQVRSLGQQDSTSDSLERPLIELREILFLHFAREEEGLFPFVRDAVPDLADRVNSMEVAHDTICGSLARIVHLAATRAPIATIAAIFDRFENAYALHASAESELLDGLRARITADQRSHLAQLVDGL